MLKVNRLNCQMTEEISSPATDDVELRTVLNTKAATHKAEEAVRKFSGNCVRPNTTGDNSDKDVTEEQQ